MIRPGVRRSLLTSLAILHHPRQILSLPTLQCCIGAPPATLATSYGSRHQLILRSQLRGDISSAPELQRSARARFFKLFNIFLDIRALAKEFYAPLAAMTAGKCQRFP